VAPTTTCLAFVRLTNLVAADILTALAYNARGWMHCGWVDIRYGSVIYIGFHRIALVINANAHFWSTVRNCNLLHFKHFCFGCD